MLTKAYSSMVLAVDVAVAIAKLVLIILESLFRLVVPIAQKSVKNEIVLVSINCSNKRIYIKTPY